MPEIQIPSIVTNLLSVGIAFFSAFGIALWISLVIWTFRDARSRSRDFFAIALATVMVVIFGPLGLLLYFLLRPSVTLAELYERSLEEEALLQDLEERPRCPGCSRVVENGWVICPDCHTQLKRICVNCGNKLHLRWNLCPFCGVGVTQASPPVQIDRARGQRAIEEPRREPAQTQTQTQPSIFARLNRQLKPKPPARPPEDGAAEAGPEVKPAEKVDPLSEDDNKPNLLHNIDPA